MAEEEEVAEEEEGMEGLTDVISIETPMTKIKRQTKKVSHKSFGLTLLYLTLS